MIRIPSSYDKYCSQDKQLINYKTLLQDLQLDSILLDGAYDFSLRPKNLQSQLKVENQKQLQEWQHQELNKLSRMSKRNHTRNLDQIKLRNTQNRTINYLASLKLVSTSLQEPKFKDIAQLNNQYYTLSTQYGVQNEQGDLFKNIIEQKDLQNSKISLTQSKTPQSIRTFKSSRNENFKSKLTGSIMKSLMDYGHQEPIMRKSDSPDFFKFNKERKFKPLEYFSPLKSVGQLFPQDQGVGVVGQLKNLEIDQRTLNLIRREFLKYDKESSGKIKIEEFKQIARKICSNEITKYHIKEIVKLFSKGQDFVEYSFIKTLSYLLMFWTKPPNISKNESTELRDLIQQNQNQNTQVRAHILELLNKLQAKLEQKYADPKSAFRLFDVNNSGDISQEEFQLTLDMIQMDISEDQGLEIFRFLDQNQDGGITLEEFSQIYTESRNRKLQTEFEKRQEINSNMDMFTTISQEDIQSKVSRQSLNKSAVRICKLIKSFKYIDKQGNLKGQNLTQFEGADLENASTVKMRKNS